MAAQALIDARIYIDGHDLSAQANAVALEYAADMKDATTFGQTTRIHTAGLKSVVASVAGHWDSSATTAVDPALFARLGTEDVPVVIAPAYSAAGDIAFLFRAVHAEYSLDGQVGELFPFTANLEGTGGQPLVRGLFLHNGSATGNVTGTAIQLGSLSATQYLYAALHVMSGTGALIVKIQSAPASNFASPTDRFTFATVATGTPVASEWAARVAGAITDTWWRVSVTNPNTRNFTVVAGIQ